MTRKIEVIAPQNDWTEQFKQEKVVLEKIFTKEMVSLYHIGSTAIKNCKAKPVIDMLLVVHSIQNVEKFNSALAHVGYKSLGENGIFKRRFFIRGGDNRSHHLHVFQEGNPEIKRHLIFRDFMNNHPEETEAYSLLKQKLGKQFPYDIESYMAGKDAFIKAIDQKAEKWYDNVQQKGKSTEVNNMRHHQATKPEYNKLVEIWSRSVRQTHDFLQENDFETIKHELPTYFPHLDVRVWTEEEKIIGFSGVDGNKLEMLFLDPEYIGKGYGKQIMVNLIKEDNIQFVDVNEQNQSAKGFYEAMGFVEYKRSALDDAGRAYPILYLKK